MEERIPVARIIEVLHKLGHSYEVVSNRDGLVVLDGQFPEAGGTYSLHFDESRGPMPLSDIIDQIEIAGIDRSAFLAELDTVR